MRCLLFAFYSLKPCKKDIHPDDFIFAHIKSLDNIAKEVNCFCKPYKIYLILSCSVSHNFIKI